MAFSAIGSVHALRVDVSSVGWAVVTLGTRQHFWRQSRAVETRLASILLERSLRAEVSRITRCVVCRTLLAIVTSRARPAVVFAHCSSCVPVSSRGTRNRVATEADSGFWALGTVVAGRAKVPGPIVNTLYIARSTSRTWLTIFRIDLLLVRVVSSFGTRNWLFGLFTAEMSLGANSRNTVIIQAVVTGLTRFTV